MLHNLYHYRAIVVDVYDGDTCTVDIDLGLKTWIKGEKIRLARIDAPEVRGNAREAGLRSRDYLRSIILGKPVVIQTIKDHKGKYGRYLGEIWLPDEEGNYTNVNDRLVQQGYAVYREY